VLSRKEVHVEKAAPLLEAKGVSKRFPGVQALSRVSLSLGTSTVHAVCGENGAGKSTLMNILMGVYQPDEGDIFLRGERVAFVAPRQALDAGVAIIAQELNPIPDMTVAENICLGREPLQFGFFVDYGELERVAYEVLQRLEVRIDVHRKMSSLSLAEIQLVEIAKALSTDAEIIIMDEPTSAIGEQDVEHLFRVIRNLKEQGRGILYVSHRLKEVFAIADEVTVLRDSERIATKAIGDIDREELINFMIGRKLEEEYLKDNIPQENVALSVDSATHEPYFRNITMDVKEGEILGIFGLMGAGRSEFLSALFGALPLQAGEIAIYGERVRIASPRDAIRHGLAYITEDRKSSGLVVGRTIRENVSLSSLVRLSRLFFIDEAQEKREVDGISRQLDVKSYSLQQRVYELSGGNQQKVVLAKWLLTKPKILLLDEPTRGIDVGAKREIYRLMSDFANDGFAIIMVSSEIPEILGMSDRIAVLTDGNLSALLPRDRLDQEALMRYASWGADESQPA